MRFLVRLTAVAALLLTLAACGDSDDSDGGGGDLSESQTAAVDLAMAELGAGDDGLALDRGCVERVVGQLSDEDAQAIVEAGSPGDAEISVDEAQLAGDLFDCVDFDALIDQVVADAEADGIGVDRGCLEDFFDGIDGALLAQNDGDLPDDMMGGLLDCIDLG